MKTSVNLKQDYPHSADEVWAALTDPRALGEWAMEAPDFRAEVGCRFQFRSKPNKHWRGIVDCEVLEVQPMRLLSYSWQGDEDGAVTTVTWQLEPTGDGTRVHLVHAGFEGVGGFFLSKFILGPGWKKMLKTKIPMVLQFLKNNGGKFPLGQRIVPECHS